MVSINNLSSSLALRHAFYGDGSVVVNSLFNILPTVCEVFVFDPCSVMLY